MRHRGGEALAKALSGCADELEQWAEMYELEVLTLEQAAHESGFSYSGLQHAIADGRIRNAGTAGRPRIRRGDLPRKPQQARASNPDLVDRVLAANGGHR